MINHRHVSHRHGNTGLIARMRGSSVGVLWSLWAVDQTRVGSPDPALEWVPFWVLKSPRFSQVDFKTSGLYARCCSAECSGVSCWIWSLIVAEIAISLHGYDKIRTSVKVARRPIINPTMIVCEGE